jgi:murein DD-endopeptidase MepM/ murein hydrolase activator NlpD
MWRRLRPWRTDLCGACDAGPKTLGEVPRTAAEALVIAAALKSAASRALSQAFDKRVLVPKLIPPSSSASASLDAAAAAAGAPSSFPPPEAQVVIVGAGLLGLYAAHRLTKEGFNVAILEQRMLIGGIWQGG